MMQPIITRYWCWFVYSMYKTYLCKDLVRDGTVLDGLGQLDHVARAGALGLTLGHNLLACNIKSQHVVSMLSELIKESYGCRHACIFGRIRD
jgi:hypothetical protein